MRSIASPRSATWVSATGGREGKREEEAGLVCDKDSGAACTERGRKGRRGIRRNMNTVCGRCVRLLESAVVVLLLACTP